jgi:hypothetical protein
MAVEVRRGPRLAQRPLRKMEITETSGQMECDRRAGNRSERVEFPSQRSNQKEVEAPLPKETLVTDRKGARFTIMAFQIGISR